MILCLLLYTGTAITGGGNLNERKSSDMHESSNSNMNGGQEVETRASCSATAVNASVEKVSCNSPWVYCDNGTCKCGERSLNDEVKCDIDKNSSVLTSTCITYNALEEQTEVGQCVYHHREVGRYYYVENSQYLMLPKNALELNEFMCGDFNRAGTLCGACKDGYYPLAYSFDMYCVQCPNGKANWWKFVLAALLPLTIFYFIVLIFKVNITSCLYGYVFYSQAVSVPPLSRALLVALKNKQKLQHSARYIGSLYTLWNLDFLRSIRLDICLETDTLQTLVLDLIVGVYPLLLMILTYLLIELHDRNVQLFIVIWKPLRRVFNLVHNNWNVRTSLIDAFVTFFFLSNVKLLNMSLDLLSPVKVHQLNTTGHLTYSWRLYYDATVPYFGHRHLPYAILAIVVAVLFVLLPMLLLLFYPFYWFQKLLNVFPFRWYILHTFMDSFQGCYKNGTEPGTRDCRWFSSVFIVVQLLGMFLSVTGTSSVHLPATMMVFAGALVAIMLMTVQPYKTGISHYTSTNANFMLLLSIWHISLLGVSSIAMKRPEYLPFFLSFTVSLSILPLVYISVIVLHWMYRHRRFGWEVMEKLQALRHGYDLLQ